jgi:hypothetical protein
MLCSFCEACDVLAATCILSVSPIGNDGLGLEPLASLYRKMGFAAVHPGALKQRDVMMRLPRTRGRQPFKMEKRA